MDHQPVEYNTYEKRNFLDNINEKGLENISFREFVYLLWYTNRISHEQKMFLINNSKEE